MKNVSGVKWVVLVMGTPRARDELVILPSTAETKKFMLSNNDLGKIQRLFEKNGVMGVTLIKDNFLMSTNDENDYKRYWIYAKFPSKIKSVARTMDSSKLYNLLANRIENKLDYSLSHLFDILGIKLEEIEEAEEVSENKMYTVPSSQIDLSEQEKEMVSKESVQDILDALTDNSKKQDELLNQLQSLLKK